MALGFGTSGVRGLVTELTDRECALYTRAFVRHLRDGHGAIAAVSLAGDFRSSTPRILQAVAWALQAEGVTVDFCGAVPTPALAAHAFARAQGSIMITGSHIPDDRNGMKFNLPAGEVLKADEAGVARHYMALKAETEADESLAGVFGADGMFWLEAAPDLPAPNRDAESAYVRRYLDFFPRRCLAGRRIVLYEHSSVARDLLGRLLEELGASVLRVGRSARFIPVDTEAVENAAQLADWVRANRAEALVSADGDGDRPLLVDGQGAVVRGDVLGILVAAYLRADAVCAPVSCNTALEKCGLFARVQRTRIGSPFVVEAMQSAAQSGARRVVGFEANGGFLLGSEIRGPAGGAALRPLPTRDAALPLLAALHAAGQRAFTVSQLVHSLPARATFSGLLRPLPTETGRALVKRFQDEPASIAEVFGSMFGAVKAVDFTDGARVTFASGDIVHLRPSGNAPEFRVYTEAATAAQAAANNATAMDLVRGLAEAARPGAK
jgi:phosphomannomutase